MNFRNKVQHPSIMIPQSIALNPPADQFLSFQSTNTRSIKIISHTDNLQNYFSPRNSLKSTPKDDNTMFMSAKVRQKKLKTHGDSSQISKNKRYTLPPQKSLDTLSSVQFSSLNFSGHKDKTKIQFSYCKGRESGFNKLPSQNLLANSKASTEGLFSKIKFDKRRKNKLQSGEYNLYYCPFEEFRRKNAQLKKLIEELKHQTEEFESRSSLYKSGTKKSEDTIAETAISAMQGIKDSSTTQDKWEDNPQKRQRKYTEQRSSLTDKLPSSKKLGHTIMLPHTAYDFGGVISAQNAPSYQGKALNFFQHQSSKEWKQIQGLLSEDSSQNMKQSIHCGPDVRANRLNCQMLKGFGRQIKESIVSYND